MVAVASISPRWAETAWSTGMIFERRALQRRLHELRSTLREDEVAALAKRLNRPGRDRLAAMWEVVVLHGLSTQGALQSERPLRSGRRPDIVFRSAEVTFIADVTTVSDDGLDERNPYFELSEAITKAASNLGLPLGGSYINVGSRELRTSRGSRTVLMLPRRERINDFVQAEILPRMRSQIAAGTSVIKIEIKNDAVDLRLTIDPARGPYCGGGFASYNLPTIKDNNPLYKALKAKAAQLRAAEGLKGIIVGDGDTATLKSRPSNWHAASSGEIVREFFRQHSSIGFVLLLTVDEVQAQWPSSTRRWVSSQLAVQPELAVHGQPLHDKLAAMVAAMPRPARMPVNGALRAKESGYGIGHHGGYRMSGNKVRMSSRELLEILAGLRTIHDRGAKNVGISSALRPGENGLQAYFERMLRNGRLPTGIVVQRTGEDESDDWIEFEFGLPDPAISPIQ